MSAQEDHMAAEKFWALNTVAPKQNDPTIYRIKSADSWGEQPIIYQGQKASNLREAVIEAIDAGVDLKKANLVGVDLSHTNLYGAKLKEADLRWAKLDNSWIKFSDLQQVNAVGADFSYCRMEKVNFYNAGLSLCKFHATSLDMVDFQQARIFSADFSFAFFKFTSFAGTTICASNFKSADLRLAILHNADLNGIDIAGVDLTDAKLPDYRFLPEGAFTGWKMGSRYVIELLIPAEARRVNSLIGRKCRAEYAQVVNFYRRFSKVPVEINDPENPPIDHSRYDTSFVYRLGETITPKNGFDNDIRIECAAGIHFFISRQEAEFYGAY